MDLLIADVTNPRSFGCILETLRVEIAHLPNGDALLAGMPAFDLDEDNVLKQVEMVRAAGAYGAQLSDEISRRFFAHAVERHFAS